VLQCHKHRRAVHIGRASTEGVLARIPCVGAGWLLLGSQRLVAAAAGYPQRQF
jgi:hypothetical protein